MGGRQNGYKKRDTKNSNRTHDPSALTSTVTVETPDRTVVPETTALAGTQDNTVVDHAATQAQAQAPAPAPVVPRARVATQAPFVPRTRAATPTQVEAPITDEELGRLPHNWTPNTVQTPPSTLERTGPRAQSTPAPVASSLSESSSREKNTGIFSDEDNTPPHAIVSPGILRALEGYKKNRAKTDRNQRDSNASKGIFSDSEEELIITALNSARVASFADNSRGAVSILASSQRLDSRHRDGSNHEDRSVRRDGDDRRSQSQPKGKSAEIGEQKWYNLVSFKTAFKIAVLSASGALFFDKVMPYLFPYSSEPSQSSNAVDVQKKLDTITQLVIKNGLNNHAIPKEYRESKLKSQEVQEALKEFLKSSSFRQSMQKESKIKEFIASKQLCKDDQTYEDYANFKESLNSVTGIRVISQFDTVLANTLCPIKQDDTDNQVGVIGEVESN